MKNNLLKIVCCIILFSCYDIYAQETIQKQEAATMLIEPEPDPDCTQPWTWFQDFDGDGHGNNEVIRYACTQPIGYVSENSDCDDNNKYVSTYTWYYDSDRDGFGNPNQINYGCDLSASFFVTNNSDCNDSDATINPNTKWYLDTNGDGLGSPLDGTPIIGCTKPIGNYINGNDSKFHWIHEVSYDSRGNIVGISRNYFDDLGKSDVSLAKDFVSNKIWGTETTYDAFGRPDKTSFIAPSPLSNFTKVNFLKSDAQAIADGLPIDLPVGPVTVSKDYKATKSITATGAIGNGLIVTFAAPSVTLKNGFSVTATAGSSFKVTATSFTDAAAGTSLANYYSDANTDELYQATATHPFSENNYDTLNPGNIINIVGGNKINGDWKTGYSYTVPAAQEMYYAYGTSFFENNRDLESYISKKEFPEYDNLGLSSYFIRTITAENQVIPVESIPGSGFNIMMQLGAPPYAVKTNYPLQRGKLYKVIVAGETKIVQILNEINFRNETGGGNININNPVEILSGSWDTYSETNILTQVSNVFNNPNNLVADLNCFKTILVDANGVENVSFTDSEGKSLARARSGGTLQYSVKSLIGPQGYVDIHLPQGCGGTLDFIVNPSLYNVYNLKTGNLLTTAEKSNIPSGTYRIELITKPTYSLGLTYIDRSNGSINNVLAQDFGVTYKVNYYDYAVNIYNKTGQLIKSIQPKGYIPSPTIIATPDHMASDNFASTYKYNALGQLIETRSPDEGTSKFAYRKNGQIRYSQSELQSDTEVSYTNYDSLGRPIEGGVIIGNSGLWALAVNAVDSNVRLVGTSVKERSFSIYDFTENIINVDNSLPTPYSLTIPAAQSLATLVPSLANSQNNLSGNVAVTYKADNANIINAITWYSYDTYGRTEWIAQYNEGIGVKTIHYEYDHNSNVKRVIFQKNVISELFVHQYTYDPNNSVLTKVETATSLSPANFITHADYSYYKTGELKRINIRQGTQGLDYVYTLGGQLKSINHPSLEAAKDPGGDNNDAFGLTLDYYNGDYLRSGRNITSSPSAGSDYNGNIKAVRWANRGAGDYAGSTSSQKGYLYTYDRNNWLSSANYGSANSTNAQIIATNSYKEGSLTYDANGNIQKLQRNNALGLLQDDLTYTYNTAKNQLNFVKDNVTATVSNTADISSQILGNYEYNAIGQLTKNNSENLRYIYNTQGLVTEVRKGDTDKLVRFSYNERGQRIKKETYNPASFSLESTTFYELDWSGNIVAVYYLAITGPIIQKEMPIYGLSRLGIYDKVNNKSTYEITDHLGNVRAVVKENNGLEIASFADYYPFGELLPGRNASDNNYRYAFQGQETDKETNMEAFQLRLWEGRLGRWLSTDPAGQYASPYLGMGNNPIGMIDSNGAFARWFTWDVRWAAGIGIDEIKISKYLKGSLSLDFFSLGTNSDKETDLKFLHGKAGLTFGKLGGEVTADMVKIKFNNEKTFYGIPINYKESTLLALRSSYSLWKYGSDTDGMDVLTHKAGQGWHSFQYVAGNARKISGKQFNLSDNYDVGGSFKIFAVDFEAGINTRELAEDIQKGMQDLDWLLKNGWGPFFAPVSSIMNNSKDK